jgi:hypothetical protein
VPRHGNPVERWDTVKDTKTERLFRVLYVAPSQPVRYWLTSADEQHQVVAFDEPELIERFEKVERPPGPFRRAQ